MLPTEINKTYYNPTLNDIKLKLKTVGLALGGLALIGLTLVVVLVAYQIKPNFAIEAGNGFDTPYLNLGEAGFGRPVNSVILPDTDSTRTSDIITTAKQVLAPEPVAASYRWTRARPILLLPGIGASPMRLTLIAAGSPLLPQGQQVELLLNGQPFSSFMLKPDVQSRQVFEFGADRVNGGSLAIEMRVKPIGAVDQALRDQYPASFPAYDRINNQTVYEGESGFKFYAAEITPTNTAGFVVPPLTSWLMLAISSWLLYFCLAYVGLSQKTAFGIVVGLSLAAGLILVFARLSLTVYTGRLLFLLIVTSLLLPMLDWLVPTLFCHWQIPLPPSTWKILLGLFLIGMLGRGGGVIYPNMEIIDSPFHIREIQVVLYEPNGFWKQFGNKELSKVPDQWESSALIPYSPFVYFYLAPIAALPLDPVVTVNLFNALLDALRVFIIYALAAALGTGASAALWAAGIYLIAPCTWLLNSWGNWPTTVSLWLSTLYILLILVGWKRLNQPATFVGATFVLLLTMLCYTVTAVFMGMVLYIWAIGLYFVAGRKEALARRNGLLIFGSTNLAAILAVGIYYAQFVPDLAATLTSFGGSLENKGSLGGFGDRTLAYYFGLYLDHITFRYGVGIFILIACVVYGWLLSKKSVTSAEPSLRSSASLWLGGAWLTVFLLFSFAQWKVDMVNKQVWFVLPLVACLAAYGLSTLWERYKTPAGLIFTRLAVASLVLWTIYGASALWLERVFIKRR